MKTQIIPPARAKANGAYYLLDERSNERFSTAWGVIKEVAGQYRYRRAISAETQRDLLRFSSINAIPVRVGLAEGKTPFFFFERPVIDAWLAAGGREWIISELEARSGHRVVAFPVNGGRAS